MDRNSLSMRVPVDRFIGMAELRDESRWADEYEQFTREQNAPIERAPITVTRGINRRQEGQAMNPHTITLPTFWASYLINGDASGLSESERLAIEDYLGREEIPRGAFVDVGEARFTWHYQLYGGSCAGGEVSEYTYLA